MRSFLVGLAIAGLLLAVPAFAADDVCSASKKGSLLMFSKVELRWDAGGALIQDTILDITNDGNEDIWVQFYFINGDEALDAIVVGDPPVIIERAHPGCNWVDVQAPLTANQPMYWSAATGSPYGVQPFTALDPGTPPGRPDPEMPGQRMLRGLVIAWAVEITGEEMAYNHLKGDAMIVNALNGYAWEYGAYAFAALAITPDGTLNMDGVEYDFAPDRLLLDFYAPGAALQSGGFVTVVTNTDLTLYPVTRDLQQGGQPYITKAKCDIWNMNEFRLSGTERCIECWDQVLLTNFMNGGPANNFLLVNLTTNKGKARIDGVAHVPCEAEAMAILGVQAKILNSGTAAAGGNLILLGTEAASIVWDIIEPPAAFEMVDYSVVTSTVKPTVAPVKQGRR
jgi:hypothetical protein